MYRYYFPNRPPVLGEIPTFGLVEVVTFPTRCYVEEIDRMAWGYIVLKQPLSPSEVDGYGVIRSAREMCMMSDERRTPTFQMVKSAFQPGDLIYVLDEHSEWSPQRIIELTPKAFITECDRILYEDHGWLWRALMPDEVTR